MNELEKFYLPYTGWAGLQEPLTLDESYYDIDTHNPDYLKERAKDQVVYKWFRKQTQNHMIQEQGKENRICRLAKKAKSFLQHTPNTGSSASRFIHSVLKL